MNGSPQSNKKDQLARIRHELRTPIHHIIGYSEILQEEATGRMPADFLDDLAKIQAGGHQLLDLIGDYFAENPFDIPNLDPHHLCHELRTPVNHIIGYSELLEERAQELGAGELVPDLRKIHSAATRWLALMEEYLLPPAAIQAAQARPPEASRGSPADKRPSDAGYPAVRGMESGAVNRSASLLVVDDDTANREMLRRRLERHGYTVHIAENGLDALRRLRSNGFDLVLLDMVMPGMDGLQVLEILKADPLLAQIPVIMISALDQVDAIARCIEMGAEDYLPVPFNPVLLQARIGAALEKKRLRDLEKIYLEQIQAEQAKNDRLLRNLLPQVIAERLKRNEETIADHLDDVTVLFADLVGFTSLSARIEPAQVVSLLNEVFTAFDGLVEGFGMEKIKTIGDAYMTVAGLPVPRPDHAEAAAALALEMMRTLEDFNRTHQTTLQMRIGLNSGPVIAGVIGKNKFIYDLWGDTVNIASRMESQGEPGRIQMTRATYDKLKARYLCEPHGPIDIRGKGPMEVYWLKGRLSD